MLAKRLSEFDSSNIRAALSPSTDLQLIDLSIGYPSEPTPEYIRRAGMAAIDQGYTRYAPGNGYPDLRAAIARKLAHDNGISVEPEQVSVTPGLTTAIMLCYAALLNPGDEVLVADPYFPPYVSLAAVVGAVAVKVDTYPDFQLTAERIKPHITSKTKVLVINSPNNPTGAVYGEDELRRIAAVAAKHGITVISDEIYEPYTYEGKHFSIGSIYPQTLTLNGFSKSYAMTGWRIGYIAGPAGLIDAIDALSQYMVFTASSVGQRAALAALNQRPDNLYAAYQRKHDLATRALSEFADIRGAAGAFYLFLPAAANDDLAMVKKAHQKHLAILPGRVFSDHTTHVRVAFVAGEDKLKAGLETLKSIYAKSPAS